MSAFASELAVVSAPLPIVDRRALSQAWYSALHLATPDPGARTNSARASSTSTPVRAPVHSSTSRACEYAARSRALISKRDAAQAPALPVERRSLPAPLARRIIARFEHRFPKRIPASIALRTREGRVHIVVRKDGPSVRLIALCTPALLDGVERALAQARYALAARGINLC
jgi:hypothetical protein